MKQSKKDQAEGTAHEVKGAVTKKVSDTTNEGPNGNVVGKVRRSSPDPEEQPISFINLFISELDREVKRSRRALEMVPDNERNWKPHEKSMEFGYLSDMVATIPTWLTMIVKQDELDVAPTEGRQQARPQPTTSAEYIAELEKTAGEAREALKSTTEKHLQTHWKLLAGGRVVSNTPRHEMLRDTINHWAHHRGQMTVYLRLMGAKVPALYGPSADDKRFD
jgi:uncharacterized damage-inducible protein DinB